MLAALVGYIEAPVPFLAFYRAGYLHVPKWLELPLNVAFLPPLLVASVLPGGEVFYAIQFDACESLIRMVNGQQPPTDQTSR